MESRKKVKANGGKTPIRRTKKESNVKYYE
jgi:hypothetical protein